MPAAPTSETEQAMCRRCGARFRRRVLPAAVAQAGAAPAVVCGRGTLCWAMEHWTAADWAGRARMARARQAAGRILVRGPRDREGRPTFVWSKVVLDRVDREALERVR